MKFIGYYVDGKNYGRNENAAKEAAKNGAKIVRKSYKV